jgi:hypothetical protein
MWNGEAISLANTNGSFSYNHKDNCWDVSTISPKEPTVTEKLTPRGPQGVPGPQGRSADIDQLQLDLKWVEDAAAKETLYIHKRIGKTENWCFELDSEISSLQEENKELRRLWISAEGAQITASMELRELEGKVEYLEELIEKKLDKPSECKALESAEAYMDDYLRAREISAHKKFARKQGVRKRLERLKGISEKKDEPKSYTVHKVVALVTLLLGIPGIFVMVM